MGRRERKLDDREIRERILWLLSNQVREKPGLGYLELYKQFCTKITKISKSTFTRVLKNAVGIGLISKEEGLYKITDSGFKKLREMEYIRLFDHFIADKKPEDVGFAFDAFRQVVNYMPFEQDKPRSILFRGQYEGRHRIGLLHIPRDEYSDGFLKLSEPSQNKIIHSIPAFFEKMVKQERDLLYNANPKPKSLRYVWFDRELGVFGAHVLLTESTSAELKKLEEKGLVRDSRELLMYSLDSVLTNRVLKLVEWLDRVKGKKEIQAKPVVWVDYYDPAKKELVTPARTSLPLPSVFEAQEPSLSDVRKLVEERIRELEEELGRWRGLCEFLEGKVTEQEAKTDERVSL
jgi:DNA-binding MarR family transcriptional regulator